MRKVRLPLHLGVDSLWRTAAASALLVPSLVFAGGGVVLVLEDYDGGARIFIGLIGFILSLILLGLAWYARASDVALDDAGLAVEGGWHGGVKLGWDQVGKVLLHNRDKPDSDLLLEVRTKTGKKYFLAEAADDSEKASVRALYETLAAKVGQAKKAPVRNAEVSTCTNCGAPLVPSDAEQVRCASCGAHNAMQASVRERVAAHRAAAQAVRSTASAVEKLLDQPGARWASGAWFAAMVGSALGWLPVVAAYLLVGVHSLGWFEVGIGFFNGWVFTFTFFAFARVFVARRRALHVLSMTFGARPPEQPGQSPGCRTCGAPLPVDGTVVVHCAYCASENVLGMNVRPLMRKVKAHRGSIEDVLREQRSERFRWMGLSLGGLIATLVGVFWLLVAVAMAYGVAQERASCEAGDAQACFELGGNYAGGGTVDQDDEAAFRYFSKACDGGHAEACNDVAERLDGGWGTERDADAARAKRQQSCKLGFEPACKALGAKTEPVSK
ncbi:MAG: sel1 repeat family protein [Deltaproteobacteria bacterium]|nr:sel1 repeat family protein [Deltaproteobacteria bacterium]MBW2534649.1 sel1 repeat family protein [Deltaproteobacteria bacterium]